MKTMARAYGDDLRRKFLTAYDRGDGTLAELASRFSVSVGWAAKISAQRRRSGQAERVPHRAGRKPHVEPGLHPRIVGWFDQKADLTLVEVQFKLRDECGIALSLPQIWKLVRRLGLRLKKSRSTPRSATRKKTGSGGGRSSPGSARSRRNA
jgi:transposase